MDELNNLDRLESENMDIDSLDLIGLEEVFGGGTMTFENISWTTAIRIKFKITLHFEIVDR